MELWAPEAGTPQGAVISPLLSNIYLDPLDHEMAEKGIEMVRYADDFVVLCRHRREKLPQALEEVRRLDGASRTDAASGQDADRGRLRNRGLRLSRLPLRARPQMAAPEE